MKRTKKGQRRRIRYRIRKRIKGTAQLPRLSVFKSNTSIYCQLIDDVAGTTIVAASSREAVVEGSTKTEQSAAVGRLIAERAKSKDVEKVVFDRGGYLYHGRVKALADGAREAGLNF
ncbi:MAG: 50S ribosomal protein L18 [Bacteroidota bacterium]